MSLLASAMLGKCLGTSSALSPPLSPDPRLGRWRSGFCGCWRGSGSCANWRRTPRQPLIVMPSVDPSHNTNCSAQLQPQSPFGA